MGFIEMIKERVEELGAIEESGGLPSVLVWKMSTAALDARIQALSGDPMGKAWSSMPVDERADRVAERILLVAERWNRVPQRIKYSLWND